MPSSPPPSGDPKQRGSTPGPKRVRGPIILLALLVLGAILIGIVVLAATGGSAPKFHSPHVLPS